MRRDFRRSKARKRVASLKIVPFCWGLEFCTVNDLVHFKVLGHYNVYKIFSKVK